MMRARLLSSIKRDERGIAAVEFAFIGTTFLILLLGTMEIGHNYFTQAMLTGAMQRAGRDTTLQTARTVVQQDAVDANVREQVLLLNREATVTFERRFYRTFSKAAARQFETFTDSNTNGRCDGGEPYTDANNNSVWDADGGDSGNGGAQDVIVYKATMTYPRMFGMGGLLNPDPNSTAGKTVKLTATTVVQNQPYDSQSSYTAATARNCT